jgi:ThiS family.
MDVSCTLFGPLREATGSKEVTVSLDKGATVRDLVEAVDAETGAGGAVGDALLTDDGSLPDSHVVTVNKQHARQRDGFDTLLSDGDTVRLTPSIMGG